MPITRFSSLVGLGLAMAGCHNSSGPPPAPAPAPPPLIAPPDPQSIRQIAFERTQCFGTCPAYEYTFRSDNSARYSAVANVADTASRDINMDAGMFAAIARRVVRSGFFAVPTAPPRQITDLSTINLKATLPDTAIIVTRYAARQEQEAIFAALASYLDSTGAVIFGHLRGRP